MNLNLHGLDPFYNFEKEFARPKIERGFGLDVAVRFLARLFYVQVGEKVHFGLIADGTERFI